MDSDSENKSNSSVKSPKNVSPDLKSGNGESHSENESVEKELCQNKITKVLKDEGMEVDTDSSSSNGERTVKNDGTEVQNGAKKPDSKRSRKSKKVLASKVSSAKAVKKDLIENPVKDGDGTDSIEQASSVPSVDIPEPDKKGTSSEEEKMDTDSETVIGTEAVNASVKCDNANSSDTDDKVQSECLESSMKAEVKKPQESSEVVDEDASDDQKHNLEASVNSTSQLKKSDISDLKTSQNKKSDLDDESVKTEVKGGKTNKISKAVKSSKHCETSKGNTSDGTTEKTDQDENVEKSNQKEKSLGIDAIAKKLGRQIKVNNEGNKESPEEGNGDNSVEMKPKDVSKESETVEAKVKEGGGEKTESKSSEKKVKSKKNRTCVECATTKGLKFQVLFQGKIRYMCSDVCFKNFKEKQKSAKSTSSTPPKASEPDICAQCKKAVKDGRGFFPIVGETKPLCSEDCLINYQEYNVPKKKCSQCKIVIEDDMNCLTWETMEFCNEDCLGKYQSFLGSHCTCCQSPVQQTSLGKYCVCFGADIRQFCSGSCLEEFKKGLKVCSFCQKDLSSGSEGFLAPVGDKGQFKDFCTQQCMERYETMNSKSTSPPQTQQCSFCNKSGIFKIQAKYGDKAAVLCSDNCVAGYRYVNKIMLKICDTCYKFFEPEKDAEFQLQFEGVNKFYCTKACMTLFVLSHRKIVPCSWCKVKKYNFDMIEKLDSSHQMQTYCSLNCISLFRVSLNATSAKSIRCDNCTKSLPAQYHLTMSDGSIRNFCSYQCVVQFQNQFTNVPTLTTSTPSNRQSTTTASQGAKTTASSLTPVISSVVSLATSSPRSPNMGLAAKLAPQKLVASTTRPGTSAVTIITTKAQTPTQTVTTSTTNLSTVNAAASSSGTQIIREVIVKPPPPKSVKNKAVLCKPIMQTKGISCKPHPCHKAVQTDEGPVPTIVPIPVPVYVPTPVHMFSRPVPCPVPFPIPIPVPIFVPLTKDSPTQVIKQLKDIQEKIPSNPFEAELLMMAEMVAENDDKKEKDSDTEAANETEKADESAHIPTVEQMTEPEAPLDVEAALPPGIAPVLHKESENLTEADDEFLPKDAKSHPGKRPGGPQGRGRGRAKRPRVEVLSTEDSDSFPAMPLLDEQNSTHQTETSDTNLRLKYAFGVNAWKHWVLQKNTQLEKGSQSSRKFKLFKTDLLQLPPDELNYSLCLFVKEVRKPSGEEYAPASIYYLCLGIQQYLFENGRIDNIFTDPYYEKFTECLNDVLLNQVEMMATEGFFISRIEEEVLWESKQLGAHSPHVLLNTLMFFNTKYFNLKSIDDHAHLSFSHITKHWRKTSIKSGPRNVILRYYPPLNKDWQRRRKEDNAMYEQNENLENPLRCPVKLYEFYLSKCPESVKTRNDVFYLYPERSCVPDSPVWYSTQALGREMIAKMLQRIKTVREIYET